MKRAQVVAGCGYCTVLAHAGSFLNSSLVHPPVVPRLRGNGEDLRHTGSILPTTFTDLRKASGIEIRGWPARFVPVAVHHAFVSHEGLLCD